MVLFASEDGDGIRDVTWHPSGALKPPARCELIHVQQVTSVTRTRADASVWCEFLRLCNRDAVRNPARTHKRPVRPGMTVERRTAQELLDRLHRVQNEYYAGGDSRGLSDLLAGDVQWSVPGDNALAGVYIGVAEVLDYMKRRRRLAASTLRLVRRDVLVGRGQRIAAVTDGVVLRSGKVHTWGTAGLYEVADGRIRRCWLLPLDAADFDAIWS